MLKLMRFTVKTRKHLIVSHIRAEHSDPRIHNLPRQRMFTQLPR